MPQFCLRSVPDLFGGEFEILEPENLSDGFSLAGQDAQVRFELARLSKKKLVFIELDEICKLITANERVNLATT